MSRVLLLVAIAACTPSVPEQPSFQLDVLPLLAANCQRCHGTPPLYDVPPDFRLDVFGDTVISADETLYGAANYASTIAYRTALDDNQMPPRFPLDAWQIETFENWAKNGAARGEPRPGNRPPVVGIATISRGERIELSVQVGDDDGDPVGGALRVSIGGEDRHVANIRSGELDLIWNGAGIPAGTYPLWADLDDGAELYTYRLGDLTIGAP